MDSDFSEFTFGYALTQEFVSTMSSLIGVPIFPSLINEGKSGGYDVKFRKSGIPLFLQFKLSSFMKRNNAKEIKKFGLYNSAPFYRMKLRALKYSKQHNHLLKLEKEGNEVYYVCPKFHTHTEIDRYYSRKEIVNNSAFIRPTTIGKLPDKKAHHIAFQKNDNFGYLLSEPQRLSELIIGEGFTQSIEEKVRESEMPIEKQLIVIIKILREILADNYSIEFNYNVENSIEIAKNIAYLTRTYLDTEFFILTINNQ